MKILIINSTDIIGGAARGAYRIHKGLQGLGVDSIMVVQTKASDDPSVMGARGKTAKLLNQLRPHLESLPLKLYKNHPVEWNVEWLPRYITNSVSRFNPDIINLQLTNNFLPLTVLPKLKKPLVWTFHGCWAFTGGCHYPYDCTRYRKNCGVCPQLGSKHEHDLSRWLWNRKAHYWKNINITVAAVSRWMAECAQYSSLFQNSRIEVIPNGLDVQLFKPIEKRLARKILNLPFDKSLVLFGAVSPFSHRKGFALLSSALHKLKSAGFGERMELAVFGASRPSAGFDLSFPVHYLGYLHDDYSLVLAYSACDLMLVPSIEEAFGQTASEAMACGTPVVAFNIGGLKDIVDHQQNGYLARPFDTNDLAYGIAWILSDTANHQNLCRTSRAKAAREFNLSSIAGKYLALYEELLGSR
jgi:glycosyltransferase involved in cell wall biosynthesis